MTGDGAQCDDVDECKVPGACFSDCVNITPGYECGSCPAGYYGNAPSGNANTLLYEVSRMLIVEHKLV